MDFPTFFIFFSFLIDYHLLRLRAVHIYSSTIGRKYVVLVNPFSASSILSNKIYVKVFAFFQKGRSRAFFICSFQDIMLDGTEAEEVIVNEEGEEDEESGKVHVEILDRWKHLCIYIYIYTQANACADFLANLGVGGSGEAAVLNALPVGLSNLFLADLRGVPMPRMVLS
ncbi:ethylene responsive transcription factor 1b [Senna tora]|uniref:Ethylene responsive transcription factor 1b n=1 Tax=Senna tora TaxID=362788 RepID=A0A834T7E2_9FABA|nr:ethylene responsive transcription factor 1b [Senna tora]